MNMIQSEKFKVHRYHKADFLLLLFRREVNDFRLFGVSQTAPLKLSAEGSAF